MTALLGADGGRFHLHFRQDDEGAVNATANKALDGFGRNFATSINTAAGRSSMLRLRGEVFLRFMLPLPDVAIGSVLVPGFCHDRSGTIWQIPPPWDTLFC